MSALANTPGVGLHAHELASLFPVMSDEEFAGLVKDIEQNGLREPIWLYDGKIIDGRNRYKACRQLGVQPRFRYWSDNEDSLIGFVVSQNLHRRHLNESQRAMVAAKLKPLFEGQARERQLSVLKQNTVSANLHKRETEPIHSKELAAKVVNISPRSVETASKVISKGIPELQQAVESGSVAVSAAALVADLPKEQQIEIVSRGEVKEAAKEIRETKNNGGAETAAALQSALKTASKNDAGHGWLKAWEKLRIFISSVNDHGGLAELRKGWDRKIIQFYLSEVREIKTRLSEWEEYLVKELKNGKTKA